MGEAGVAHVGEVVSRAVVIVTYNSARDVVPCLAALGGERVIVVDNNSRDGTPAAVESRASAAELIRNRRNRGFAAAANQGMVAAGRADVVLVNPDVVIEPRTLDRLSATARATGAGIVAPALTYSDGRRQESARSFPTLPRLLARCTPLGRTPVGSKWRDEYLNPVCSADVRPVDWAIGAAMYIPRWAIDMTGGFDEAFFLYGEDVDLCTRIWSLGSPVILDAGAVAAHRYRRGSRRLADLRRPEARHHWMSMLRLASRYPRRFFTMRPPTCRSPVEAPP